MWPGAEIWFLWLLLSGFPPKRAVVFEQGLLSQLVAAKPLPCGLSLFPPAASGSPGRTVSVLRSVAVCWRDLCSRERSWGPCSPPGLATAWAFVAGLTPHASAGEDFLVASPPRLRSRADAAFSPSQYYEMSYGLNIEMHKQVSLGGTGALSQLPCPCSPSPPCRLGPSGSSLPTESVGCHSQL